jgi:hypothetical protein
MMGLGIALALLLLAQNQPAPPAGDTVHKLIHEIAASGRVVSIGARAPERVNPPREVPPGAPPLLLFRYLDGMGRHRFGQLGLVIDDAGH